MCIFGVVARYGVAKNMMEWDQSCHVIYCKAERHEI